MIKFAALGLHKNTSLYPGPVFVLIMCGIIKVLLKGLRRINKFGVFVIGRSISCEEKKIQGKSAYGFVSSRHIRN